VGRETVLVSDPTLKKITSGRDVKLTRIEAFVTNRFNINLEPSVCRILLALEPAVVLWSGNNWYLCRAVEGVL
jgi:hypothetical protein